MDPIAHATARLARATGLAAIATASSDRIVQLWDPLKASSLVSIPVHHDAVAVAWLDSLAIAIRPSRSRDS
jgi:hypothetical protein